MVFGREKKKEGEGDDGGEAFDAVPHFKARQAVHAITSLGPFICLGGSKLHIHRKSNFDFVREAKAGHDITALCAVDGVIYAGLDSGGIKELRVAEDGGCDPSFTKDESMAKGKVHTSPVTTLEALSGRLHSGAADGSAAVWDMRERKLVAALDCKKRGAKGHVVKHFPQSGTICVAANTKEEKRVLMFPQLHTEEHSAVCFSGVEGRCCKAISGYTLSEGGTRVFLSLEDGVIFLYDAASDKTGWVQPVAELQHLHKKPVNSLDVFGQYLVVCGSDRLVTVWNGREQASEPSLLRKLCHKGPVTSCCVDGSPLDGESGQVWCYDESNRKVYQLDKMLLVPVRGHLSTRTYHIDPIPESPEPDLRRSSAAVIEAALSPPPGVGSSSESVLDPGPPGRKLHYEDFFQDHGPMQDVFDAATAWIHRKGIAARVVSVQTLPVIGTRSTRDAMFRHSLSQAVYDATVRTVPEMAVPVLQAVRVVYWAEDGRD
eukprot:TRINITY_DN12560_c0_g1_i3.p1 TRINITY_DN12560_c0_g1~~TRINITY_DN12560_c0_g1_i3.p1  ORF type:complete len:488 (+),score=97.59 TRINITY_DN12560_c0_g1_i3:403-1866(+)